MKHSLIVDVLPQKVWMDIFSFPWISRKEFGKIVDRIGNFQFAEHAQFYLHEWGERRLDELAFKKNGFFRLYIRMDVPQTPIPENIKSFENFRILHFDARTMDFLGRIGSLLTDVDIELSFSSKCVENIRTVLTNVVPLLNGVRSLECAESVLPVVQQCFGGELANMKVLKIHVFTGTALQGIVNSVMDWLTSSGQNGGPKLCEVVVYRNYDSEFPVQLSRAVREQFLAAKTLCTFASNVIIYSDGFSTVQVVEFHEENGIGEELHGEWVKREEFFRITRHRANSKLELQEWINKNAVQNNRPCIQIDDPTIGPIAAAQMDVQRVDGEQLDQQPSTSKEA